MKGKHLPPNGRLVMAVDGSGGVVDGSGGVVDCVAYHRLDGTTTEMKRLYVRPAERGHRALARCPYAR